MAITINDIAQKAGVSRSTVSRVLTNNPNVSPNTRELVKKVIEECKFQPSSLARGLALGTINVIALIVGDVRNPFYAELTWVIENKLSKNGYMVVLCDSDYDVEREVLYLKTAKQYGFAGVVMISAMENNDLKAILKTMNCPIVLLNRYIKSFDADVVIIDNFQGGYIATRHLIELGHTKIGILTGPTNSNASMERLEGYKKALETFNVEFRNEYVVTGDLKMECGLKYGQYLMDMKADAPTAVFAGNDLSAIGIMNAYKSKGKKIPNDLSIVGFDDIPMSETESIALTTVRHPYNEMGEKVSELILEKIRGNSTEYKKIIFNPKLIVRKSTKPIK